MDMTDKHKYRVLYYFSWGTIFVALASILAVLTMIVYPYRIIEFKTPFEVENKIIERGNFLKYTFDYCKYTDEVPEVKREYIDGIIFISASTRANVVKGCNTVVVSEPIPETLPAGEYKMRITVTYHPNLLREITYVNETETFKVIERE